MTPRTATLVTVAFIWLAGAGESQTSPSPAGEEGLALREVGTAPLPREWKNSGGVFVGIVRVLPNGTWLALDPLAGAAWVLNPPGRIWTRIAVPRGFHPTSALVQDSGGVQLVAGNLETYSPGSTATGHLDAFAGGRPMDGRVEGRTGLMVFAERKGRAIEATEHHLVTGGRAPGRRVLFSTTVPAGHFADFPTCRMTGVVVQRLLAPELAWRTSPSTAYVVAGNTHAPTLSLIRVREGSIHTITLERTEDPSEVGSLARLMVGAGWQRGDCTVPPDEVLEGRMVHGTAPAFLELSVDDFGQVWVSRPPPRGGTTPVVERYGPDGTFLGSLPRGTGFPVSFTSGGFIGWRARPSGNPELVAYEWMSASGGTR